MNKTKLVKLRLVPVEVFGAEEGYGLMDAVEAWSDCNRAYGKIYRVDDIESRTGETVEILVKEKDLPFFEKRFESQKPTRDSLLQELMVEVEGLPMLSDEMISVGNGKWLISRDDVLSLIKSKRRG